MLSSALDETGGIVTSKFDEYVAKEQKAQAEILKQQRLWHDERVNDAKRGGDDQAPNAQQGQRRGKKGKDE